MNNEREDILPERGPLSAVRAWFVLAVFSAQQMLRSGRSFLVFGLLAVPAVVVAVIRLMPARATPLDLAGIYWAVTVFVILAAVVPLSVMIFSTMLIRSQAADGTLVYLFTRRVGRSNVFLARFAGTTVVLTVLVCLSQLLLFAAASIGKGGMQTTNGAAWLGSALVVSVIGTLVFSAIFAAISTFLKWPLGTGFVYLLVFEWVFASIPLNIREFSINYYLRCILLRAFDPGDQARELLEFMDNATATAAGSIITLAVVACAAVAACAVLVARKEFTRAQEEQK